MVSFSELPAAGRSTRPVFAIGYHPLTIHVDGIKRQCPIDCNPLLSSGLTFQVARRRNRCPTADPTHNRPREHFTCAEATRKNGVRVPFSTKTLLTRMTALGCESRHMSALGTFWAVPRIPVPGAWHAIVLFVGLIAILLESVLRRARQR